MAANGACRNGSVKNPCYNVFRFYFSFLEYVYPSCVEINSAVCSLLANIVMYFSDMQHVKNHNVTR